MNDILCLLSVSGRFLEGLEDQGTGSIHDTDFTLLVLDLDLDFDLDSSPILGGFLDIFTDLLGWHTDWGALGGERSGGGDFTSNNFHADKVDSVWVKCGFRRHSILFLPIY